MWNAPPKERLASIPKLYGTQQIPLKEKLVYLHFFIGSCDWYVCEFDGDDTFWGFVILNGDLFNAEWGYFSYSELKAVRVQKVMEVDYEIIEHWEIRPASTVEKIAEAQWW